MSDHIYKAEQVTGSSTESIEDAVRNTVSRASQTLRNLEWIEVQELRGRIDADAIAHFQVVGKVGFRLE
jgi:flavin-binding protein dodecin